MKGLQFFAPSPNLQKESRSGGMSPTFKDAPEAISCYTFKAENGYRTFASLVRREVDFWI